jgi:hypothetical protein
MSWLEKLGVIEKSSTPSPTVAAPVAAKPVSLILAATQIDKVISRDDTPSVSQNDIDNAKSTFEELLQTNIEDLGIFHKFLESVAKLTRITDVKTKYLSALDFTGNTAEQVLASADKYPTTLETLVTDQTKVFTDSAEPRVTAAMDEVTSLTSNRNALLAQLEEVEGKLKTSQEALDGRVKEVQQTLLMIIAAKDQMLAGYTILRTQMDSLLK